MLSAKQNIVFIKYGSFSYVNHQVEVLLRKNFPESPVVTFDIARDILSNYRFLSLWLRFKGCIENFAALIRNRHSPWDFVFRSPLAWRLISQWIEKNIHPNSTRFIFQTQSMFNAKRPQLPLFIYTDHTHRAHKRQYRGGTPAKVNEEWGRYEEALYQQATHVFTLSEFCTTSLLEDYGIPPEKVSTVSTGMNIELPSTLAPLDSENPVIMFVGQGWKIKGGPHLLESFKKVRREIPHAELWIVGSKPDEEVEGVKWFDRVNRDELSNLFLKSTVLCVPSIVERASMVSLDAAAHGLPVITTNIGAGPERIRDKVTGLLVVPGDVEMLANAIVTLITDRHLARKMGAAGRRLVEEEFSWEKTGQKISLGIKNAEKGLFSPSSG